MTKVANTRARILAAAEELFASTSMRGQPPSIVTAGRLARQAGVSQSSLYNHFKGGVAAVAHALLQNPNNAEMPYVEGLRALATLDSERVKASDNLVSKLSALVNIDNPDTDEIDFLRRRVLEADRIADSSPLGTQVRAMARCNLGWAVGRRESVEEGVALLEEATSIADKPWLGWIRRQAEDQIVNLLLIPSRGKRESRVERAIEILQVAARKIPFEPIQGHQWPAIEGFSRHLLASMLQAGRLTGSENFAICELLLQEACSALAEACNAHSRLEVFSWWGHAFVLELVITFEALTLGSRWHLESALTAIQKLWPDQDELESAVYRYPIGLATTLRSLRDLINGDRTSEPPLTLLGNWPVLTVPGLLAAAKFGYAIRRTDPFVSATCGSSKWRKEGDAFHRQYDVGFAVGANRHIQKRISEQVSMSPRPQRGHVAIDSYLLDQLENYIRECKRTGRDLRPDDSARLQWIWQAMR